MDGAGPRCHERVISKSFAHRNTPEIDSRWSERSKETIVKIDFWESCLVLTQTSASSSSNSCLL